MSQNHLSDSMRCVHFEPDWSTNPEIVRWVAPLEGRYCIVCVDWVGTRDREQFVRYVRDAFTAGKTESEIARALELNETADPFAPPRSRTYFQVLLAKSGYVIHERRLQQVKDAQ